MPNDFGPPDLEDVLDRLTDEWLMQQLDEEERTIVWLKVVEELAFPAIGVLVGEKFRGRPISASVVRYHWTKILEKLQALRVQSGED